MAEVKIKGLSGPLLGKELTLKDGTIFGRNRANIKLDDPKVSNRHAIVKEENGRLKLVDNGSKNGIRKDGVKVKSIELLPGTQFQIGNSLFQVERDLDATVVPQSAQPPEVSPEAIEVTPPPPKVIQWNDQLADTLSDTSPNLKNFPAPVVPLDFKVTLNFLSGPQLETSWHLGYGPRTIGRGSIDLPILEANAPDICFEIIPTPQSVTFKTSHAEVLLNGRAVSSKELQTGDIISIGQSKIEVELSK